MPKIVRIINRFNLGGPTFNAAYLSKYMAPEFETILIGGEKDLSEDSSTFIVENLGLKPIIIPEMKRELSLKNDRIAYQKIKKIIKDFKPDIVHTHASKAGAIGRMAAVKCGVPVIVHTFHGHVFHSYFGKFKTMFYKNVERYLAKKSSAIVTISNLQKKELVESFKIIPKKKARVIHLGFDLEKFQKDIPKKRKDFRSKFFLEENEIAVGIIGRLVPIKNHGLLIEALAKLNIKESKKVRCFIIGDGETLNQLKEHCNALNLDYCYWPETQQKSSITFTSWIKDIDWANAGLDVVVLTSDNEGTPVSIIEAQASGKPVISTRVGGVEDIVIEGETAFLTEKGNVDELYDALQNLIDDESLRNEMSKLGWNHVKNKFHYSRLVRDMKSLYYELLE